MTRAARVMAMAKAKKRAMATNGNNMGNGYGKEGGGQATGATMAMGKRMGMMVVMGHGLCVFCVCGETKK